MALVSILNVMTICCRHLLLRVATTLMNQLLSNLLNRPSKQKTIAQLIALLAGTTAQTTANAQQAIVNQQTGVQVELTRAYWNANVDIADRSIKCDRYRFNAESAVYEFYLASEYIHAPLLTTSVESYVIAGGGVYEHARWWVQDGVYSGEANFNSHEYIELVNYEPSSGVTSQASNNNAIRVWHSASTYSVCIDQSGTSFIPTGSADTSNTNLVVLDELDDFSFQFPPPLDANHEVPVIYRDGEQVGFVRGEWGYNKQLANETVSCVEKLPPYNGIGSPETPLRVRQDYLAYFGGDSVYLHETYSDFDAVDRYTYSNSTSNINLGGVGFSDNYMELTEAGFNLYVSESRYFNCTAPTPKRVLALIPDSCDYSTADQFDGWGWNPITQQGCPPLDFINDAMGEDEQMISDDGVSDDSVSGDQSIEGDDSLAIAGTVDDSSGAAGNDSPGAVGTEDQSNSVANFSEQTSGSGTTDKFLLLFLIYFLGRKISKIG